MGDAFDDDEGRLMIDDVVESSNLNVTGTSASSKKTNSACAQGGFSLLYLEVFSELFCATTHSLSYLLILRIDKMEGIRFGNILLYLSV